MDLWRIVFFLASTVLTMVESGCFYLNPFGIIDDVESMCAGWWNKAKEYEENDDSREDCVSLIERKCPSMLTITSTLSREYDPDHENYEIWVTEGVAKDQKGKVLKYYKREEKRVCSYEQGKVVACEYWWGLATGKKSENNVKNICIDSILKNCPGLITLVKEESDSEPHPCVGDFPCRTITYKDTKGEKASFNYYETW